MNDPSRHSSERARPDGEFARFGVIAVQVALITLLSAAFHIETASFTSRVMPIAAAGFLVHHYLPLRARLPFFAALSLVTVLLVLGVAQGAWLVALGGLLIAIAHLPLRFALRVALLIAVALALAAARVGVLRAPWSSAIWPVLGSMFMFRLIAYMYDLRHDKQPPNFARTIAYFFCLPNVAFPLFPVIDFATFRRTHFDRDAFAIYQQGVNWMVRGLLHLVAYRLVYRFGVIGPNEAATGTDLLRYMVANFALYLRVSGQFHLIVGILHLFGFRLPETHRFFYLASSFPDFWRRINIYWKDFMTKVFYFPAYFRFKARGETVAIAVSTLVVFVATWALHSYQWFWILGTWLLSWTDTLFWGILALLLVVAALREAKRGRQRVTRSTQRTWHDRARIALGTAATFTVLCVLWTLWTSATLSEFLALVTTPRWRAADIALGFSVLLAVVGASLWSQRREQLAARGQLVAGPRYALLGLAPLALLWSLGEPHALRIVDSKYQRFAVATRHADLNRRDQQRLQRGYYERLVAANGLGSELWKLYAPRPRDWQNLEETGVAIPLTSPLILGLRPNSSIMFNGARFSTNQWGMRDKDYTRDKPARATRIALLGASHVMGSGVADGETFESIVEERLSADSAGRAVELLNFSVSGASLQQQVALLESGTLGEMGVDAAVIFGHFSDLSHGVDYLVDLRRRGIQPPDTLTALMRAAGFDSMTSAVAARRLMRPFERVLMELTMRRAADVCAEKRLRCYYAYLSLPLDAVKAPERETLIRSARKAGLGTADFGEVYAGHDEHRLIVAEWDRHPNVLGHRVIADMFGRWLTSEPNLLPPSSTP